MVIENICLNRLGRWCVWKNANEFYNRWDGKSCCISDNIWIVPGTINPED